MDEEKKQALDWIYSYKNFPQLYSINKAGFPIGRTTWFPIEDDWSIHATGYRGNARVQHIRRNPHLEAMWLDTTESVVKVVRIRALGYNTDNDSLVRIYDEREDIARAAGDSFGDRLVGKDITDTVCCTHLTPQRVTLEGFGGSPTPVVWDVDPGDLNPEPPPEDGSEPPSGPTGFRQTLELSIEEASRQATDWCRSQPPRQHLYTVQDNYPTGQFAELFANDDWSTDVIVSGNDPAVDAVSANSKVELAWIDISHDAPKMSIPKAVFVQGTATVLDGQEAQATIDARAPVNTIEPRVMRVQPRRIRTEGFGEGLQLYAWNV